MVINFITNTFTKSHAQNIAVDSWKYIQDIFQNSELLTINWHNLQFKSQTGDTRYIYENLVTDYCLSDSISLVPDATKNLPFMNELFEYGLGLDGDYFVIHNSDIIIMPHLLGFIDIHKPDAWSVSRMEIENISSFDDCKDQKIKGIEYAIGHDLFVFKREWAERNKSLFTTPFLLGSPIYDLVWAGYIKCFGDNTPMGNSFPPFLFHIKHPETWLEKSTPERLWNEFHTKATPLNMFMLNIMNYHITFTLSKRQPIKKSMAVPKEEKTTEQEFFKYMSYSRKIFG